MWGQGGGLRGQRQGVGSLRALRGLGDLLLAFPGGLLEGMATIGPWWPSMVPIEDLCPSRPLARPLTAAAHTVETHIVTQRQAYLHLVYRHPVLSIYNL